MQKVVCISAGQLSPKKANNHINRRNLYLNYGLLSLASVLRKQGLDPVVIHGHFQPPQETLKTAIAHGLAEISLPILLSIPSFYAVAWAGEFIAEAKALLPQLHFVVGGRWVIGNRPDRLQDLLLQADRIVSGLSEEHIAEIVTGEKQLQFAPGNSRTSTLDYSLLHQRHLYQPSIEIARGCGMGCNFCQEKDEKLQPLKPPHTLVSELQSTLIQDDWNEMTPYFETSMFVPNRHWANELSASLASAELAVKWRTEARVDTIKPELIPLLGAAGLSVLDLGLESASPVQLLRMQKTRDPEKYLERASLLLEACAAQKIKVKANILLFAGENDDTIGQTIDWLEHHREGIYGVSVSPVIIFGWPEEADTYLNTLAQFGATRDHSPCPGITHINLSAQTTHEDSLALSRLISTRFMPADHYYRLKSFSYFPRNYSFNNFLLDIAQDPGSHSFNTEFLADCHQEISSVAQ